MRSLNIPTWGAWWITESITEPIANVSTKVRHCCNQHSCISFRPCKSSWYCGSGNFHIACALWGQSECTYSWGWMVEADYSYVSCKCFISSFGSQLITLVFLITIVMSVIKHEHGKPLELHILSYLTYWDLTYSSNVISKVTSLSQLNLNMESLLKCISCLWSILILHIETWLRAVMSYQK